MGIKLYVFCVLIVNNVGKVSCGGMLFFLIFILINVLIIWLIIVLGFNKGERNGRE